MSLLTLFPWKEARVIFSSNTLLIPNNSSNNNNGDNNNNMEASNVAHQSVSADTASNDYAMIHDSSIILDNTNNSSADIYSTSGVSYDWEYLIRSCYIDARSIIIQWLASRKQYNNEKDLYNNFVTSNSTIDRGFMVSVLTRASLYGSLRYSDMLAMAYLSVYEYDPFNTNTNERNEKEVELLAMFTTLMHSDENRDSRSNTTDDFSGDLYTLSSSLSNNYLTSSNNIDTSQLIPQLLRVPSWQQLSIWLSRASRYLETAILNPNSYTEQPVDEDRNIMYDSNISTAIDNNNYTAATNTQTSDDSLFVKQYMAAANTAASALTAGLTSIIYSTDASGYNVSHSGSQLVAVNPVELREFIQGVLRDSLIAALSTTNDSNIIVNNNNNNNIDFNCAYPYNDTSNNNNNHMKRKRERNTGVASNVLRRKKRGENKCIITMLISVELAAYLYEHPSLRYQLNAIDSSFCTDHNTEDSNTDSKTVINNFNDQAISYSYNCYMQQLLLQNPDLNPPEILASVDPTESLTNLKKLLALVWNSNNFESKDSAKYLSEEGGRFGSSAYFIVAAIQQYSKLHKIDNNKKKRLSTINQQLSIINASIPAHANTDSPLWNHIGKLNVVPLRVSLSFKSIELLDNGRYRVQINNFRGKGSKFSRNSTDLYEAVFILEIALLISDNPKSLSEMQRIGNYTTFLNVVADIQGDYLSSTNESHNVNSISLSALVHRLNNDTSSSAQPFAPEEHSILQALHLPANPREYYLELGRHIVIFCEKVSFFDEELLAIAIKNFDALKPAKYLLSAPSKANVSYTERFTPTSTTSDNNLIASGFHSMPTEQYRSMLHSAIKPSAVEQMSPQQNFTDMTEGQPKTTVNTDNHIKYDDYDDDSPRRSHRLKEKNLTHQNTAVRVTTNCTLINGDDNTNAYPHLLHHNKAKSKSISLPANSLYPSVEETDNREEWLFMRGFNSGLSLQEQGLNCVRCFRNMPKPHNIPRFWLVHQLPNTN